MRPSAASALLLAAVVALESHGATVSVEPAQANAFVPVQVSIREVFPAYTSIRPEIRVDGNVIRVFLNGDCEFLCPPSQIRTLSFALPALRPGHYELVVHDGAASGPPSATLATARLSIAAGRNYQGLWWASPPGSESGWGLQVAHQEETLFATWYTYDAEGKPTWYVMPSGARTGTGLYTGALYRATSTPAPGWSLRASSTVTQVGSAALQFGADGESGTFSYSLGGISQSKPITRQVFGSPVPICASSEAPATAENYQDLWWSSPAGAQPGWGIQIAQQGKILFATLFGYDAQGNPAWRVMPEIRHVEVRQWAGVIYETRGPALGTEPWRADQVRVSPTNVASFDFPDHHNGTLMYLIGSGCCETVVKRITRQLFARYPTVCD